jgi:excisionase family DNA binding protein
MPKSDRLSKQEAMELLGLKAAKSIERYVSSGKLVIAEWVRPASGGKPAPLFDRTELERFKETNLAGFGATEETQKEDGATEKTALLPLGKATKATGEATGFLSMMAEWERRRAPLSDLAHKLTLGMDEAARLSGIPAAQLRAAAKTGQLTAVKIGRGVRVRRDDLQRYVDGLFASAAEPLFARRKTQ